MKKYEIKLESPKLVRKSRSKSTPGLDSLHYPGDVTSKYADIFTNSKDRKLKGIRALGNVTGRDSYPLLIELLAREEDKDIIKNTINSLASIRDSRALFPLINYFNAISSPAVRQRILQYIDHTADPRANDFLMDYIESKKTPFKEIAESALAKCNDPNFVYRYKGTDEELKFAQGMEGQLNVTNTSLTAAENILKEYQNPRYRRPQTYVIPEDGIMLIGGHIHEHVQVARGRDVLTAGEVEFEKTDEGLWRVSMINNRSCGYFPARNSFKWVKDFFTERSDVKLDHTEFEGNFPRDGWNDDDFLSINKFGLNYKGD
jgi:hypothetical protein